MGMARARAGRRRDRRAGRLVQHHRQRVLDICDLLIDASLPSVPWIMINGIRANLADEELLGSMRAGRLHPHGLRRGERQPGDPRQRHPQAPDAGPGARAFAAAKQVGMETIGFFIVGMPGETEQTMDDTIRFACELDPLVANFSIATPFPAPRCTIRSRTRAHPGR